jgi:protoporphyrinogen oxidase
LDDAASLRLKEDPVLDGRIAASSQADPMQFYRHQTTGHAFRNFYPTGRGLATFCDRAEERLRAQGVGLRFNSRVERVDGVRGRVQLADGAELTADRILWAADAPRLAAAVGVDFEAEKHIHRVPMMLYYFIIPKEAEGAWTYLHDFDEETLVFRASVPGGYVADNPCPAGQSYVCAEVPAVKGSEIWTHPERFANRVWAELQRQDVVRTEQPLDTHLISVPVTYTMPRAGFSEAWQSVHETLQAQPRIEGGDFWSFSKNTITRALAKRLEAA